MAHCTIRYRERARALLMAEGEGRVENYLW